ncbi:hypothetical protein [Reinekea blandensis]|uniref:Haemolysin activator HlyB C-terminal domain-containing protein n=1 Tax=Reinekea blandensis MED297 TaxID=314283 RepID=A4B907_9GAMM|nr:hypothetical protein [Reinekea blandensis]EAR11108.1 hypothetical protein MED297_19512 [Reinekea sp. MED297] [Reinekea blandensis MED297]
MMMTQYFNKLTLTLAFLLSGCAIFPQASNEDRLSRVAGRDFVLSVQEPEVDLSRLPAIGSNDDTVLRLVSPELARQAYQSNGNRTPGPVTLTDPSGSITNALAKYYVREHELRFIARGSIRNLDPAFIQRALSRGDFVLDVRLTHLELRTNEDGLFFPLANYQLTVVDRERGRNLLQDNCTFAQPSNAQPMQYFTTGNGTNLSRFLQRFASPCLQYFAKGTSLPSANQFNLENKSNRTVAAGNSFTRVGLQASTRYYPDYPSEASLLNGVGLSVSRVKRLHPTVGFEFGATALAHTQDQWPALNDSTLYGGEMLAGFNYFPDGDADQGYHLLLRGQVLQTRQNSVLLSTNAIGLSAGLFYPLFSQLHVSADYSVWQHVGPTTESNLLGHELRVSLRYQYD